MFALPNAKRVRRSELDAASDEGASSPTSEEQVPAVDLFRQRMSGLFDLDIQDAEDTPAVADEQTDNVENEQEKDENGFEFNLFAPGQAPAATDSSTLPIQTSSNQQQQRIRLSPSAAGYSSTGKFIQKSRPLSHYLAPEPDELAAKRLKSAALSADFIRQRAAQPWPDGRLLDLKKPWRVSVWTASPALIRGEAQTFVVKVDSDSNDKAQSRKRTRVGKKTRLRRRLVAARRARKDETKQRQKEDEAKRLADKEEHMRRKKSEMNRKKQIRKREKERERKAGQETEAVT